MYTQTERERGRETKKDIYIYTYAYELCIYMYERLQYTWRDPCGSHVLVDPNAGSVPFSMSGLNFDCVCVRKYNDDFYPTLICWNFGWSERIVESIARLLRVVPGCQLCPWRFPGRSEPNTGFKSHETGAVASTTHVYMLGCRCVLPAWSVPQVKRV